MRTETPNTIDHPAVTAAYHATDLPEPSAALDARILAAARQPSAGDQTAANDAPATSAPRKSRWITPIGLAATLVLGVSIGYRLVQSPETQLQQGADVLEERLDEPSGAKPRMNMERRAPYSAEAEQAAAPSSAPAPVPNALAKDSRQADAKAELLIAPRKEREQLAPQPKATHAGETSAPPPPELAADNQKMSDKNVADSLARVLGVSVGAVKAEQDAPKGRADAQEAKRQASSHIDVVLPDHSPAAAPKPAAPAVASAAPAAIAERAAATTGMADAAKPAPSTAPASEEIQVMGIRAAKQAAINVKRKADSQVDVVSAEDIGKMPDKSVKSEERNEAPPAFRATPEKWLTEIRKLLRNAERERALLELRKFRKRYPDYLLPNDLNGLL